MVWVLRWSNVDDVKVTLWQTQMLASMQGCTELQEFIEHNWDMSIVEQASEAQFINNLVSAQQYMDALQYWNNCELNNDSIDCQFWVVEELEILDYTKCNTPTIFAPDYFTSLLDDEEDEDEDDEDDSTAPSTQPSAPLQLPGATCRKCHTKNEYAYADRLDGTYVCRQCSTFKSIFGS